MLNLFFVIIVFKKNIYIYGHVQTNIIVFDISQRVIKDNKYEFQYTFCYFTIICYKFYLYIVIDKCNRSQKIM